MFKDLKEKLSMILAALGFTDKAKSKTLTNEDWVAIEASFKEKYGTSLSDAMQEAQTADRLAAERNAALEIINANEAQNQGDNVSVNGNGQEDNLNSQPQSLVDSVQALVTTLNTTNKENSKLRQDITNMAAKALEDKSEVVIKKQLTGGFRNGKI